MIPVEQLRVGNWIAWRDQYIKLAYHHIRIATIHSVMDDKPVYEPIYLTREILENVGFTKSGNYWFKKNVYLYEWGITNISFYNRSIMDNDDPRYTCIEIKSFHQLQNYFFALEGEELEIDLNTVIA